MIALEGFINNDIINKIFMQLFNFCWNQFINEYICCKGSNFLWLFIILMVLLIFLQHSKYEIISINKCKELLYIFDYLDNVIQ
jgi:hypothetical protein